MKIRIENRKNTSPFEWRITIDGDEYGVYDFDNDANDDIELDLQSKKVMDILKMIEYDLKENITQSEVCIGAGSFKGKTGTWWLRTPHKEEKKMLNVDKYRERIDRIIENGGAPRHMILRMCLEKTNLESVDTAATLDWLFSEYEPPLLENGDGLKPGDWIMVRNDEKAHWAKRVFAYYYNDHFYAAVVPQDLVDHAVYKWKQARLLEDGE